MQGIELDELRTRALVAGLQERPYTELHIGFNAMSPKEADKLALKLCRLHVTQFLSVFNAHQADLFHDVDIETAADLIMPEGAEPSGTLKTISQQGIDGFESRSRALTEVKGLIQTYLKQRMKADQRAAEASRALSPPLPPPAVNASGTIFHDCSASPSPASPPPAVNASGAIFHDCSASPSPASPPPAVNASGAIFHDCSASRGAVHGRERASPRARELQRVFRKLLLINKMTGGLADEQLLIHEGGKREHERRYKEHILEKLLECHELELIRTLVPSSSNGRELVEGLEKGCITVHDLVDRYAHAPETLEVSELDDAAPQAEPAHRSSSGRLPALARPLEEWLVHSQPADWRPSLEWPTYPRQRSQKPCSCPLPVRLCSLCSAPFSSQRPALESP